MRLLPRLALGLALLGGGSALAKPPVDSEQGCPGCGMGGGVVTPGDNCKRPDMTLMSVRLFKKKGEKKPPKEKDYLDMFRTMDRDFIKAVCKVKDGGSKRNYYWNALGFRKEYWKSFGYEHPCDPDYGLARAFNGFYVLENSYSDMLKVPLGKFPPMDGRTLAWAYSYTATTYHLLDDLRAECSDEWAESQHSWGLDNATRLQTNFFYMAPAVQRASSLFHEAHHHTEDSEHKCDGGKKDVRWNDGGAYTPQTLWLIDYYERADRNAPELAKRWAGYRAIVSFTEKYCQPMSVPKDILNFLNEGI